MTCEFYDKCESKMKGANCKKHLVIACSHRLKLRNDMEDRAENIKRLIKQAEKLNW